MWVQSTLSQGNAKWDHQTRQCGSSVDVSSSTHATHNYATANDLYDVSKQRWILSIRVMLSLEWNS